MLLDLPEDRVQTKNYDDKNPLEFFEYMTLSYGCYFDISIKY